MFDSLADLLSAIHAFFEHATIADDLQSAAHDQILSVVDLHQQISNYIENHSVLPDDLTSITEAFTQHEAAIPLYLLDGTDFQADIALYGSGGTSAGVGRNAAEHVQKFLEDYLEAHHLTFGGDNYTGDDDGCMPLLTDDLPRFAGGLWPTLPILEVQIKGDCMAQMLEKMAQLYYGDAWGVNNTLQNHLADHIQEYAMKHNPGFFKQIILHEEEWGRLGAPDPINHLRAFEINPAKATDILHVLGIDSHWSEFNHTTLVSELNAHKPVGVLLDAQYLPGYSSGFAPHAITLTGTYYDAQGQLMYYGIDTNVRQVCIWTADNIVKAVEAYTLRDLESYYAGKVLLLDHPVKYWPYIMP